MRSSQTSFGISAGAYYRKTPAATSAFVVERDGATSPAASEASSGLRIKEGSKTMRAPVIVLGSGRCGSTLLQRVLNTSPTVTIWGEHGGFLKGVANSYFTLTEKEPVKKFLRRSHALHKELVGEYHDSGVQINWVNPFDPPHVVSCFRRLILDLFARELDPLQIHWGFKEIRYNKQDRVVEMWRDLFPETLYIFSVRNPYSVIKSMMIAWHKENVARFERKDLEALAVDFARRWNDANRAILHWQQALAGKCLIVPYEQLVQSKEVWVDRLFEFLDVPRPPAALSPFLIHIERTDNSEFVPVVEAFLAEKKDVIDPMIQKTARALSYTI